MPTKRTPRSRAGKLSPEALAWVRTADAVQFFDQPGEYLDSFPNSHMTPIQRLPDVPPHWRPLALYWWAHLAGEPLPNRAPWHGAVEKAALAWLLELHAAFEAAGE